MRDTRRIDELIAQEIAAFNADEMTVCRNANQNLLHEGCQPFEESDEIYHEYFKHFVDRTKEPPQPEPLLMQTETQAPLFREGGLSLLVGLPKCGKTHAMISLCASVLGCGQFGLEGKNMGRPVIYVDTEQGAYDAWQTQGLILKLLGWPLDQNDERFRYITLRRHTNEEIHKYVIDIVTRFKPSVMFIDGLVDILPTGDFNDIEDSSKLVRELMAKAEDTGTHICGALHLNKNGVNERGHLGSIYLQKAECNMEVRRDKESDQVEIRPYKLGGRTKDFKPIWFRMDNENESIPVPIQALSKPQKPQSKKEQVYALLERFYKENGKVGRTNAQLTGYIETMSKTPSDPIGLKRSTITSELSNLTREGSLVKGRDNLLYPKKKLQGAAQGEINTDIDGKPLPF